MAKKILDLLKGVSKKALARKEKEEKRAPKKEAKDEKVGKVMREFKEGELHSGKEGPVVKDPKQAVAIALSEAGLSRKDRM